MANRYFAINRGQTEFNIVESSSSNTGDVELNIDLSKNVTKSELVVMLEEFINYINSTKTNYPPS